MTEAVGAELKNAREALGLTVSEVAHQLKLAPRQVEALEAGRFDALPGRGIGAPRRLVERVLHRLHEMLDALLCAPVLAEEISVVMVDVGVVWRKTQPALEVVLRERVFLELLIDEAVEPVGRRVRRIRVGGGAQFLQRDAHGAALVVGGGEVGVHARAVARIAHAAGYGPRVGAWGIRLRSAPGDENRERRCAPAPHARTSFRR